MGCGGGFVWWGSWLGYCCVLFVCEGDGGDDVGDIGWLYDGVWCLGYFGVGKVGGGCCGVGVVVVMEGYVV